MPKMISESEIVSQLEWLNNLEESSWSRGLLDMATDLASQVRAQREKKAEIDVSIKKLRKLLVTLPRRAERESELIYTKDQIITAKVE